MTMPAQGTLTFHPPQTLQAPTLSKPSFDVKGAKVIYDPNKPEQKQDYTWIPPGSGEGSVIVNMTPTEWNKLTNPNVNDLKDKDFRTFYELATLQLIPKTLATVSSLSPNEGEQVTKEQIKEMGKLSINSILPGGELRNTYETKGLGERILRELPYQVLQSLAISYATDKIGNIDYKKAGEFLKKSISEIGNTDLPTAIRDAITEVKNINLDGIEGYSGSGISFNYGDMNKPINPATGESSTLGIKTTGGGGTSTATKETTSATMTYDQLAKLMGYEDLEEAYSRIPLLTPFVSPYIQPTKTPYKVQSPQLSTPTLQKPSFSTKTNTQVNTETRTRTEVQPQIKTLSITKTNTETKPETKPRINFHPIDEPSKEVKLTSADLLDGVTWRQGIVWYTVTPPYDRAHTYFSKSRPVGVFGARTPKQTVRGLKEKAPQVSFTTRISGIMTAYYRNGIITFISKNVSPNANIFNLDGISRKHGNNVMNVSLKNVRF